MRGRGRGVWRGARATGGGGWARRSRGEPAWPAPHAECAPGCATASECRAFVITRSAQVSTLPQRSDSTISTPAESLQCTRVTIQVSQLCFEAALPLFEEEAAAGGDASGSSLRAGGTRAFERLHARAIALSEHAGTPSLYAYPASNYALFLAGRRLSSPLLRPCTRSRYDAHPRRLERGPERADRGACGGLGGAAGRGHSGGWAGHHASPPSARACICSPTLAVQCVSSAINLQRTYPGPLSHLLVTV